MRQELETMEDIDESEYPQPSQQFTPSAPAAPVEQHPLGYYPQLPVPVQQDLVVQQQPMPQHMQQSMPLCVHPVRPLTISKTKF